MISKSNDTEASVNPFLMIRATVEAELPAPGILAVSSALARDGKTGVSAGIVRSLTSAGYAVLAVDAGASTPHAMSVDAASSLLAESARPVEAGCDFVSIAPAQARSASAGSIAAFFATIRERYDYAIVDAAVINAGGLAFARSADGVVLALREGRAVSDADREAVELFARLHVRFLGVIATRDESRAAEPQSLYDRLQPRAAGRRVPTVSADEPARGAAAAAYRSAV
jgi:Mrp family chromosome partitioning ATPase